MDLDVAYMPSVKNLHKILDSLQHAAVPDSITHDFLKDLGYSSSNDRPVIKLFKYLGFLDASGRPQDSYREFVDHTRTKLILAKQLKSAYNELFISNKKANEMTTDQLKGWFRSKTGKGDSVAKKMATTFKALTDYADFSEEEKIKVATKEEKEGKEIKLQKPTESLGEDKVNLVYRIEIHLPDTQNIQTYKAIFKAIREEIM